MLVVVPLALLLYRLREVIKVDDTPVDVIGESDVVSLEWIHPTVSLMNLICEITIIIRTSRLSIKVILNVKI